MKTIVVFYHARFGLPLREANESHLFCWRRYSRYRTVYVNVAFAVPWRLLRSLKIDAVIFDTIFLSMHWSPDYFMKHAYKCAPATDFRCPKIGLVQDEFINMKWVSEFLAKVGVTHLLTASTEADWPTIYCGLNFQHVKFQTVLTGYVDERRLAKLNHVPLAEREIDIGYRAWANPYWLGEHGQKKVEIGRKITEAAQSRALSLDINHPEATDFLIGNDWFRFLQKCKAVLGVEGGSSIFDRDGSIKRRVDEYLSAHPGAAFEETRSECFPNADGTLKDLAALSPRHLEAAMTKTCQILLEGTYNSVLRPWEHYVPLKSDYSNVDEVLDVISDVGLMQAMVDRAYKDIVASQKWSYRKFVRDVERDIIDNGRGHGAPKIYGISAYLLLIAYDRMLWVVANAEASSNGKRVRDLCRLSMLAVFESKARFRSWGSRGLRHFPLLRAGFSRVRNAANGLFQRR
jgi:hypothetical protein